MKDAAATLGVSASTLRRLADEGRIATARTEGGHRRFDLHAIRQFAAEKGAPPGIRPIAPPDKPIPTLASELEAGGVELAATAAAALYRGTKPGWYASDEATPEIRAWVATLAASAGSGRYAPALERSEDLRQRAHRQGVTLLESHGFLDRFRDVLIGSLGHAGAAQEELTVTRHLFAALQQAMLARYS